MNLCHHRPLFTVTAVFVAAMAVGSALTARWLWFVGGLLLLLAGLLGFLFRRDRRRTGLAVAVCLAAVLGCVVCLGAFHDADGAYLSARTGETVSVTGTVTDCRSAGGFLTSYALDVEAMDGSVMEGQFLLTCQYVSDLQPGYRVTLTGTLVSLEEAAGEGFDAAALRGDGYTAGLVSESEEAVTVLAEDAGGLSVVLDTWRRQLAAKLELLCGRAARGLPSALLLGDRSALSDEVRRDFARTGVSHILSISGMHMTLLFGMLAGLLKLLRIPKRMRVVLLGVGAVGYLALIGFLPSATRAVVMLGMVYLATLWSGRADPLTSLGVAGAGILLVSPHTVYDIGFWMSMTATFGLLAYAPLLRVRKDEHTSLLTRVWSATKKLGLAVGIGVVAMSFSLFLVAMAIGEIGILSPVVTLILTPATALLLILSPLVLITAGTPLSPILAAICTAVSAWMADVTEVMGDPAWVVVSLRHPAVLPVAVCMAVGAVVLLVIRLPERRRWTVVMPLVVGWVLIGGVLGVHRLRDADTLHTTYLQPSSQADILVTVNGQSGVIFDISNGSLTSLSAAAREAEAQGATEIGVLMLTHYHTATSGSLSRILAREAVRALWLPTPTTPEDYYRLLACLDTAERAGVPAIVYAEGDRMTIFGDATVTVATTTIQRSTQPVLLLTLDTGDERLVLCGAAIFESSLAEQAEAAVAEAGTVIFGHHGPITKEAFGGDLTYRTDAAIILPVKGHEAGLFEADALPEGTRLWWGQKRMRFSMKRVFEAYAAS